MRQIVSLLVQADPNRIILFDSPPLLLTSESRVLASVVGQITLVVRAGSTPQQAVLDALDMLGDSKPIGLVLNQCDEQTRKGYYQYYGQREDTSEIAD
jgi:Mrp family chromosome partitioning ATPase